MTSIEQAWQQAQEAFAGQRWNEAQDLLEELLASQPNAPGVLVLLSYVYSYQGRYRAARDAALSSAAFRPDSIQTSADVASRLRTFNAGQQMVDYVRRLGHPSSLPIPLLLQCAAQFSYLNLQPEAHRYLKEALEADPLYPPTLVAMAQVLVYMGRGAEAELLLNKALLRAPQIPEIYGLAGQLFKQKNDLGSYIASAERLLVNGAQPDVQRAKVAFGLHHLHDSEKRYSLAFLRLGEACRLKRRTLNYAGEDARKMFDSLKSLATGRVEVVSESAQPTAIFIIGMHRSGTTLLEQMLDGHPLVHGAGELYDFTSAMRYQTDHHCQGVIDQTIVERASAPGFDFKAVGERYLQGLGWRIEGKPYFTDKLPSNFLNSGFICQALPQAKLLHMVRDPVEVCFSNLRELFSNANPYSYDQIELADFYLQYHRLMAHWREVYPRRILDIRYDRMVRDPEAVIREVCDFCGLEFTPEMLAIGNRKRGVSTASAVQVREGIQVREVPKWKPYEAYLQPMINRLREGGVLES